jgi:quercetin dioxygenase-like cupin family protein
MPVLVDIELPGVTAAQYAGMIEHVGAALVAAPGFLSHAASPREGAVHILELWRTEEEWARFVEANIAPMAKAGGLEVRTRLERLERLVTPPQAGAPREGAAKGTAVRPLAKDEGESFRLGPLTIVVKEDGSHTRQTVAVAEFRGKGFRIPVHEHTEHDETIYVLEGELGVRLGDATFTAPAGTSFTIPIGAPHSVWNESEVPVRFLNTIVPARYLDYFHEMALVAKEGKLAPPEEMKRVMARYGLKPVAPPPAG